MKSICFKMQDDSGVCFKRPTQKEAEKAVEILLSYIGENPKREGLLETPRRFVNAFSEQTKGYQTEADSLLKPTFDEVNEHQDFILLRDIKFESLCEHHLAMFTGVAHVAYVPSSRIVGISKLARVVDVFAKRLQIQERMTSQIAKTIWDTLKPKGVFVMVKALHHCMVLRGVSKANAQMVTLDKRGIFKEDKDLFESVLSQI